MKTKNLFMDLKEDPQEWNKVCIFKKQTMYYKQIDFSQADLQIRLNRSDIP